MKGTKIGNLKEAKFLKATLHPTSSKIIVENSFKSLSSCSGYRKSFHEQQKQTLQQEKAIAESGDGQGNIEDSECNNTRVLMEGLDIKTRVMEDSACSKSNPTKVGIQMLLPDSEALELPILEQVSTNTSDSSCSCAIASSSRSHDLINHHFGSSYQAVSSRSFFRHSTHASRNSGNAASSGSQGLGTGAHRCGLRSLIYTSPSDAFPSVHSSFSRNRQIDAVGKRLSGGENCGAKVKGTSGSSTGGHSASTRTGISSSSRSLTERRQILLNIRNRHTSRYDAVSVRTGRASAEDAPTSLSEQGVGNILPVHKPVVITHLPQNQVSISEAVPESSSLSSSTELLHVLLNSSERPGSSSSASRNRMVCTLGDRDGYSMERIEEVSLASERIEQGEELTHEQSSVQETNLFSGGRSFHDRHRDMRMDIDNMSYEELLALEEIIGSVSTGLSREQLSECLKRSIYTPASEVSGVMGSGDDTKCSICQEEYVSGDEMGQLACKHHYHVACIDQWLGRKNWCPICKASAIPS